MLKAAIGDDVDSYNRSKADMTKVSMMATESG